MSAACLVMVMILFYPKHVPNPEPLYADCPHYAILDVAKMGEFIYTLNNVSSVYGKIEKVWPLSEGCLGGEKELWDNLHG